MRILLWATTLTLLFGVISPARPAKAEQVVLPLGTVQPAKNIPSGKEFFKGAAFVGAGACKECHAKQYQDWAKTWHSKMERLVFPQNVVGNFNNVTLTFKSLRADSTRGKKKEKISPSVKLHTDGKEFFFTLVDKDNPKNNQTYKIHKTLGGKWDQHYETKIGDNYYPTPMRWAVSDKAWLTKGYRPNDWFLADGTSDGVPRKPGQMLVQRRDRAAEAKCAGCHMTGYTPAFDKKKNLWKAAPPTAELGISCEKCHGPGSQHVKEAKASQASGSKNIPGKIVHPLKDLNSLQQIQLCSQCHGRNTNKKEKRVAFPIGFLPGDTNVQDLIAFWSYSGDPNPNHYKYFWPNDWAKRNRQQWQDFQKSVHFTKAGMTCLTCHTFHGEWYGNQLRLPREKLCVQCHTEEGIAKRPNREMFEGSPMAKAETTCVDCHMPKIGYRTNPTAVTRRHWDTTSHTFMVATPELTLRYGVRSSCAECHTEGKLKGKNNRLPLIPVTANAMVKSRQASVRTLIDRVQDTIKGAKAELLSAKAKNARRPAIEAAEGRLARAAANVKFVLLDGSMGFHNIPKADTLLKEAEALTKEARSILKGR